MIFLQRSVVARAAGFSRGPGCFHWVSAVLAWAWGIAWAMCAIFNIGAAEPNVSPCYLKKNSWQETMVASRAAVQAAGFSDAEKTDASRRIWERIEYDFPVQWDWMLQDGGSEAALWFARDDVDASLAGKVVSAVLAGLGGAAREAGREIETFTRGRGQSVPGAWLDLYVKLCEQRRAARLKTVLDHSPRIIFTKHPTLLPSFFAYTEGQSDAQAERHFMPGAALCLLEMDGLYGTVRTLLSDPRGAIRDPAVSYDARRVLFAWKKSLNDDDYHLYELDIATGHIRQLTSGLGFADYEGCYLPNGDIVFTSTRCVQTVDCWWTEVSNIYTCDASGQFLRRLAFDQVHSIYPTVTEEGRVIYTRWDYNDRGQIFPQALFQMNPDGTGQSELYGNSSWFPTTIAHARGIPGTQKVLAIFTGHHSPQTGKLGVIDPTKGRQENTGAQLAAPMRKTPADRIDSYGQQGELFQYPYPLNEHECLVTYAPQGWEHGKKRPMPAHFSIYYMNMDGGRELLASDPRMPCNQPAPLAVRAQPQPRPSLVDYRQSTGSYYLQDIYAGPGLRGIPRGTIKKLRVVALEFRAAGVGNNGNNGEAGGALVSTPIAIGNGSWDVKVVLGDAQVRPDGSASFLAPARTPVYFQALDENGRVVQTMRSWSTLQPGEHASCVGCHEHKNSAPPVASGPPLALAAQPQTLEPFYGPPRGFSFIKEIQPILDRHCVTCHDDRQALQGWIEKEDAASQPAAETAGKLKAFSLLGASRVDPLAKRHWSDAYLALTRAQPATGDEDRGSFLAAPHRLVNWISPQSAPPMLPPYSAGSAKSDLIPLLEKRHHGVALSREELDKIACWIDLLVPYCGDYTEANAWTGDEVNKYRRYADKRGQMEAVERQNIQALLARPSTQPLE